MVTADYIRLLLDYNYTSHRRIWDCIASLSDEQFTGEIPYSIGSIRNHMVHVVSVDGRWLARCMGTALPNRLDYTAYPTQQTARAIYDTVEKKVLDYASSLDNEVILKTVDMELKDRNIVSTKTVWEILVHVANHGTDHRAQVLRILHELGAPTFEQDLMIYWWDQEK